MKVISIIAGLTTMCLLLTSAAAVLSKGKAAKKEAAKKRSMAGNSLKQDYDSRHQDVPKTPIDLSIDIMSKLYNTEVDGKGGLPTMEIMYKLDNLRGVPRLQTLLMFEKMDTNADGTIGIAEFTDMYGSASSAPHRAFRTLFRLFDYDNNNFISVWEILRNEATLMGYDSDLTELGRRAEQKFRAMDGNGDNKVSPEEFISYMNYLGITSIGKVKKDANTE